MIHYRTDLPSTELPNRRKQLLTHKSQKRMQSNLNFTGLM